MAVNLNNRINNTGRDNVVMFHEHTRKRVIAEAANR